MLQTADRVSIVVLVVAALVSGMSVGGSPKAGSVAEQRDDCFSVKLPFPVVRYQGLQSPVARMQCYGGKVRYYAPWDVASKIKVGMTANEVSNLLRVDFSESAGIFFPMYLTDAYLYVGFEDGRVSKLKTGHNGVCLEQR